MKKLSLIYLAILLVACAGVSGQATLPTLAPEANQADCDDVFIHVDGYEHDESVIEMIDGKPIDGMLCYIKDRRLISKQTYKDGWEEGPAEWYYEHNACDPDDLEFCKVEAIAYFKQGLLNGRINKYYESGKLATEGTFLDGKRQGPQTDYYENGNLKSEIFLKDDQQHGLATFYYESGGVSSTQYWVAGKGDGLTTNYDETGKLKSEIFYKNGEKNGLAKEYDENEKLKTEIIYANGKKNEFAKEYYGNGQLKSEVVYKDDKLVGSAKYYYEDGALKYDAPVQYKPSLDVLHSGNDLLKEYEALSPDEKIAQKEDFLKRINNLKYFSPKITGYTLRDINGDAVPEYMVFDKDGLISVSAVHEGKISVKPTIEDKLKLSTDGLFYKASCYSNKYGCMAALRYEEEDSYFYLIETARIYFEVAIFGDSGIPTPNYIKIENGERISITEDEYYELQKFYQNPSNQMKPEFVIVSSDIFDNDMKVETRRLKSEDYPAVYKDAPIEYKPVLDGLYALNKFGSDSVYNEETIFGDDDEISADSYAVVDINGDGIKELLLGEDTHIATIHTLDANGKPVLLAAFPKGDDIKVTIGTVYNTGGVLCKWIQADANTPWVVYTYVLEQNATSLIEARLTYDYIDPEDSKTYYGIATEDGLTRYIDKAKFDKFENEIKSVKPLKFTFIPIL